MYLHRTIGVKITDATKWLGVGLHATEVKERGRPSILIFFLFCNNMEVGLPQLIKLV